MKVKCIRLLDSVGKEVTSSSWLSIGDTYHVLSIFIDQDGRRSYGIVGKSNKGEWPNLVSHQVECFQIVSTVTPSNWRPWLHASYAIGISPISWQSPDFYERFYDHDPAIYEIFKREFEIILAEDP